MEAESNMKSHWPTNLIWGEGASNKCFIIFPTLNICALITVLNATLTRELRNVNYANHSSIYHSISSFDRTLEMACSTSDSSLGFYHSSIYHSISSFDRTLEMACSTSDSSLGFYLK